MTPMNLPRDWRNEAEMRRLIVDLPETAPVPDVYKMLGGEWRKQADNTPAMWQFHMKDELLWTDVTEPQGRKFDNGKMQAAIIFEDFPDALRELVEIAHQGAVKYDRGNWKHVINGEQRYVDAMSRHFLQSFVEPADEESGKSHLLHLAWNAFALYQMRKNNDSR